MDRLPEGQEWGLESWESGIRLGSMVARETSCLTSHPLGPVLSSLSILCFNAFLLLLLFLIYLFRSLDLSCSTQDLQSSLLYVGAFFFPFTFISWRLITLQYCSGFCHTST